MKRKLLSAMLATTMVAGMVAGCGSSSGSSSTSASTTAEAEATEAAEETTEATAEETAAAEGSVLNIECWNTEFQSRVISHYPGYEVVDDTTGKIGDVTVNWHITPSDDNAYQNNLDSVLPDNESAADDSKVDLFLVEADYALKYINGANNNGNPVAISMDELGITSDDLADQYQYTKDIVTDADGAQRGISWQACSSGLIFNRQAAIDILGTDDLDAVQEAVSSWDAYKETAAKAKEAGYTMCSVNDTYRVYSNNVTSKWVDDSLNLNIDDNIKAWVDDSKELADAGEENTYELWGDDWGKGKYADGKVFCYFGPAWFFNFSLAADDAESIAANGGWGFVVGPQSFYWGGTWICAATGTDNADLVKDIMLTICTDDATMKDIAQQDSDCVNNKAVLAELAADESGNLAILGGQNPYETLAAGAELVDMSNISDYDQGCNEEFQNAMKGYFEGNATYDEALAQFKTAVGEKYPELNIQ